MIRIINKSELRSTYIAVPIRVSNLPVRNFSEEALLDEIKRVINCTEDISREKKATGIFWDQRLYYYDNVNAVFPILTSNHDN
jgi:hypothetical protein